MSPERWHCRHTWPDGVRREARIPSDRGKPSRTLCTGHRARQICRGPGAASDGCATLTGSADGLCRACRGQLKAAERAARPECGRQGRRSAAARQHEDNGPRTDGSVLGPLRARKAAACSEPRQVIAARSTAAARRASCQRCRAPRALPARARSAGPRCSTMTGTATPVRRSSTPRPVPVFHDVGTNNLDLDRPDPSVLGGLQPGAPASRGSG